MNCGLVLCSLQHPVLPCPSCRLSLLSQPSTQFALAAKLYVELDKVLQQEAEARESERLENLQRELEAAGGGAFPVLHPSAQSNHEARNEPRKVLSLNTKTKKATITTFSRATIPQSAAEAASTVNDEDDLADVISHAERKTRVPPPKVAPDHAERTGTERRWEPLKGGGAMYVQPPRVVQVGDSNSGTSSRRKKGKGGKATNEGPSSEPLV